ncbi:MAG: hypothetical protein KBD37_01920 [Burkholderiales bacterium]|nr:hypothetical protein [Burkholderiales bacterium]
MLNKKLYCSSLTAKLISILLTIIFLLYIYTWGENILRLLLSKYPTEYRDMATVQLTYLFSSGKNPYNLETSPPFFYLYGFLFSYLCAKLGSILYLTPLFINKIAVVSCIIIAGLVIGYEVAQLTKSLWLTILAFTLMLDSGYNLSYFIVRPDSFGLLLTILAIFLTKRSISIPMLFIIAVISVSSFYTKQYYIYIIIPISLYIACIKPKYLIFYGLFLISTATISIFIISKIFPYYFYATIFAQAKSVNYNFGHMVNQNWQFFKFYLLLIIPVIYRLYTLTKQYCASTILHNHKNSYYTANYIAELKKSLSHSPINIYILQIIISLICLMKLGGNEGAYMSYYNELLLPEFIVIALFIINKYSKVHSELFNNTLKLFIAIWISLYGQNKIYLNNKSHDYSYENNINSNQESWKKAYKILDMYASPKMFLSPILANYPLTHGIDIYDNGNTEYCTNLIPSKKYIMVQNILFPQLKALNIYYSDWIRNINDEVAHGEFSLVTSIQQMPDSLINRTILQSKYKLYTILYLRTGEQVWATEFWVPINQ